MAKNILGSIKQIKKDGLKKTIINAIKKYTIMSDKSLTIEIPNNLTLQLGINDSCNGRCKFCASHLDTNQTKEIISQELLYNYLLPLYPKTKVITTSQGELTHVKEGYDYLKFLDEKFHHINVFVETNGIAFNEKWQKLAVENKFIVNFSINASNRENYAKNVWGGEKGEVVFDKVMNNFDSYLKLLKQNNLSAFNPFVSCVLNSSSYDEILNFLKMALKRNIQIVSFHFDTNENDVFSKLDIKNKPEYMNALRTLLELERVLKSKVKLYFRLFMAHPNLKAIEEEVRTQDLNVLKDKYSEIYELAKHMNLKKIIDERNDIAIQDNKLPLTYHDLLVSLTYRSGVQDDVCVCLNPWTNLRIWADGYFNVCSWRGRVNEYCNFKLYVKDGKIDWNDIFNGYYYKKMRKIFKEHRYLGCMGNCPAMSPPCDIENEIFAEESVSVSK